MTQEKYVLVVRNLKKTYGNGVQALKDVSFNVKKGEFIAVLGSSGSGKSTLIRTINQLIPVTSGQIFVAGNEIQTLKGRDLRRARRRIGMIFQHYNLVDRLSVMQNVLHGTLGGMSTLYSVLGRYPEERKQAVLELLDDFSLRDYAYKRAGELSGGQKQRVGIARALMQNPEILLCDEPISSLDPITAGAIMDLLSVMAYKNDIACIVNLHQVNFARQYASRIIGIAHGEVVYDGPAGTIGHRDLERIYGKQIPLAGNMLYSTGEAI